MFQEIEDNLSYALTYGINWELHNDLVCNIISVVHKKIKIDKTINNIEKEIQRKIPTFDTQNKEEEKIPYQGNKATGNLPTIESNLNRVLMNLRNKQEETNAAIDKFINNINWDNKEIWIRKLNVARSRNITAEKVIYNLEKEI